LPSIASSFHGVGLVIICGGIIFFFDGTKEGKNKKRRDDSEGLAKGRKSQIATKWGLICDQQKQNNEIRPAFGHFAVPSLTTIVSGLGAGGSNPIYWLALLIRWKAAIT